MTDTQISKAGSGPSQEAEAYVKPHYLITTADDAYTVDVMLPGVPKEGITAVLEDGHLTVTGERDNAIPDGWQALTREIGTTSYRLKLKVNVRVDEEAVTAKSEDGVLTMRLPKVGADQPRKVDIA